MADSPLDVADLVGKTMHATSVAIRRGVRDAMREIGDEARRRIQPLAVDPAGSDKKFSGTKKYNGGRLGVKVRYDHDDTGVRVAPMGPWGLPAGRGGAKTGKQSWGKGRSETLVKAEKIVPEIVGREASEAFRRG